MKAHDGNLDALLNGFVDGELSPRQRTEIKRLVDHDPEMAARLGQAQSVRDLLRSLPREEPPDEIAQNLRGVLERRCLLDGPDPAETTPRRRYLVLRRLRAAAAVLVLLGALSALVYHIVSPLDSTGVPRASVSEPPTSAPRVSGETLRSTYELHVAADTDLAGVLNRAIADRDLSAWVRHEQTAGRETYRFVGPKASLGPVLTSLQGVWGAVDRAQLRVGPTDETVAETAVIEAATPEMVARLLSEDSPAAQRQLAQRMGGLPEERPGPPDRMPPLVRPVLTGSEGPVPSSALNVVGQGDVSLIITIFREPQPAP